MSADLRSDPHDQPGPKRRRRRPALSCEQCRRRKMKCDRGEPCNQCTLARNRPCTYSSPESTDAPIGSLNNVQQQHLPIAVRFFADEPLSYRLVETPPGTPSYPTPQTLPSAPSRWESYLGTPSDDFGCGISGSGYGGTVSKTRLFGQSHWMHSFGRFNSIISLKNNPVLNSATFKNEWSKTEIMALLRRCKSMAKAGKLEVHNEWLRSPDMKTLIPPRTTSDTLINLYFATCESLYRVLHQPSFRREYDQFWVDSSSASSAFILRMLLAMANGAVFYQESDVESIRSQAKKWIFAGHQWLSDLPAEKSRLCISGLQVHCLLILARQAHGTVGDLAWVAIGTLLRSGLNMGLHRDPKFFPRMSQMQGEIRKRLWATILEINVQLSLDMGLNPLISADDYDTGPPGNFNDFDLDDSSQDMAISKPSNIITQSTVQIVAHESLALRLKVCKLINNFRDELSYETVLELGGLLTKACKDSSSRTHDSLGHSQQIITQLQRNLLDISIRRFLFLLHGNFCMKAFTDPRFYFSRKVCLDSAIRMATYPSSEDGLSVAPLDQYPLDQYTLLKIFSADFFKRVMIHSPMTIVHEIIQQVEDDSGSPAVLKEQSRRAREPLKVIVRGCIDLVAARIPFEVSNSKCHVFMSAILGQVEAMEDGTSPEMGAIIGAKQSANVCLAMLDSIRSKQAHDKLDDHGISTPVDEPSTDQFGLDWNVDWEGSVGGSESWLFTGWEEDKSW